MDTLKEYLNYLNSRGYNTKNVFYDYVDGYIISAIIPCKDSYITLYVTYDEEYLETISEGSEVNADLNKLYVHSAYIPCCICNIANYCTGETSGIILHDVKDSYYDIGMEYFEYVIETIVENPFKHKTLAIKKYSEFVEDIINNILPILNDLGFELEYDSYFDCYYRDSSDQIITFKHKSTYTELYTRLDAVTLQSHVEFLKYHFTGNLKDMDLVRFKNYLVSELSNTN